jgi:hypothetical protein
MEPSMSRIISLAFVLTTAGCLDYAGFREVSPGDDGGNGDGGPTCNPDDTAFDRNHCGECDNACAANEGCFHGTCAAIEPTWVVASESAGNDISLTAAMDEHGALWIGGAFATSMMVHDSEINVTGETPFSPYGFIGRLRKDNGNLWNPLWPIGYERKVGDIGTFETSVKHIVPRSGNDAWMIVESAATPDVPVDFGFGANASQERYCETAQCAWLYQVRLTTDEILFGLTGSLIYRRTLFDVDQSNVRVFTNSIKMLPSTELVVSGYTSGINLAATDYTLRARATTSSGSAAVTGQHASFLCLTSNTAQNVSALHAFEVGTDLFQAIAPIGGDEETVGDLIVGGMVQEGVLTSGPEGDETTHEFDGNGRRLVVGRIAPVSGQFAWLRDFACGDDFGAAFVDIALDDDENIYGLVRCPEGPVDLGGGDIGTSRPGDTTGFLASWTSEGMHRWSIPIADGVDPQRVDGVRGGITIIDGLVVGATHTHDERAEVDFGAGAISSPPGRSGVLFAYRAETGALVWGDLLAGSGSGPISLTLGSNDGRALFMHGSYEGPFGSYIGTQRSPIFFRFDLP